MCMYTDTDLGCPPPLPGTPPPAPDFWIKVFNAYSVLCDNIS